MPRSARCLAAGLALVAWGTPLILPVTASAQGLGTSLSCHNVQVADAASKDKFMASLGLAGSGASLVGLVVESKPWQGRLALVGAAAAVAGSLYTLLREQKTVNICVPSGAPSGFPSGLTLIGPPGVLKIGPSGRFSPPASMVSDYASLVRSIPVNSLPQQTPPSRPPWMPPLPEVEFDVTKVRGFVLDARERRLPNATVRLISLESGNFWVNQLTDWDGAFELVEAPGKYVVYVHADGHQDYTETVTKTAFRNETLEIHLKPAHTGPRR